LNGTMKRQLALLKSMMLALKKARQSSMTRCGRSGARPSLPADRHRGGADRRLDAIQGDAPTGRSGEVSRRGSASRLPGVWQHARLRPDCWCADRGGSSPGAAFDPFAGMGESHARRTRERLSLDRRRGSRKAVPTSSRDRPSWRPRRAPLRSLSRTITTSSTGHTACRNWG
jgi:hypothetical protein